MVAPSAIALLGWARLKRNIDIADAIHLFRKAQANHYVGLLVPTRFATSYLLTQRVAVSPAACNLLSYPRFLSPHWLTKVEKVPNADAAARQARWRREGTPADYLPHDGSDDTHELSRRPLEVPRRLVT